MIEHARGVVTSGIASSSVCVCVLFVTDDVHKAFLK